MTGGAGYVGSACLRGLLRYGHCPVAFDNLSDGHAASVPENLLEIGDIASRSRLVEVIKKHKIDAIMHFAAVASVPESIRDPERYWRTNVVGTKNVLDAMCDSGVNRIVFSSTAAVYSFDDVMPIDECTPTVPQTPYGTSKLAAEFLVRDYAAAYGLGFAILRYFNAAGADMDGEFGEHRLDESHLIPLTLRASLRNEPVRIYGSDWDTADGTCVRDFIHTEDLMHAHRLALDYISPGDGVIYNVGSNMGTSVLEVLKCCEQVVGKPIPHEFAAPRRGDPGTLIADSRKLRSQLNWRPRYGIEEIIESAWRWHSRYTEGYNSKEKPD